jgi:hypothetical protein
MSTIFGHMRRIDAVVQLEAFGIGDAQRAQLVVQPSRGRRAPGAVAAVAELDRRAQHDFFFALGKDDALRIGARGFMRERQHRRSSG